MRNAVLPYLPTYKTDLTNHVSGLSFYPIFARLVKYRGRQLTTTAHRHSACQIVPRTTQPRTMFGLVLSYMKSDVTLLHANKWDVLNIASRKICILFVVNGLAPVYAATVEMTLFNNKWLEFNRRQNVLQCDDIIWNGPHCHPNEVTTHPWT